MDLYFFDLDRTLYAYDFRYRLPELARLSGVSQYRLAKSWWVAGFEERAEGGEWPTSDAYLDQFARITGGRRLSLEEWASARAMAMTRIDGSVAALRRASQLGMVSLLSNNPSPLAEALLRLAPDVVAVLGDNVVVSYMLDSRKPEPEFYRRALDRYGARAEDTFFADDNLDNVLGARALGITAHHLNYVGGVPQTDSLMIAVEAFASRNRSLGGRS